MLVTVLFALDFGGIAAINRSLYKDSRDIERIHQGTTRPPWVPTFNPLRDILLPILCVAPLVLAGALLVLYLPRPVDQVAVVLLVILVLIALLVPALKHS